MANYEGNGRPNKNTVGNVGDIYTDLTTGKKYECHGTRGFIDIDIVDEPVEYKWEALEEASGGISDLLELSGGSGTLEYNWDLDTGEHGYQKHSDAVPTITDFDYGASLEYSTYTEGSFESDIYVEDLTAVLDDGFILMENQFAVVPVDNYTYEDLSFSEKGTYLFRDELGWVEWLKLDAYIGFNATMKLKSEYLPSNSSSSEFIVNVTRDVDIDTMEETVSLDKTYDEIMANLDSAVLIEEIGGGRKYIYRFASKELDHDTQELYPVFHGYTSNLWDESENCNIWHRFIRVNADNTVSLISVLIKDFATS